MEYDITSRNADLAVLFPQEVSAEQAGEILGALRAWRQVGFFGGFRRAELHPLESNFFPAGEPEAFEDLIEMHLKKSTVHEAAYQSLINVLVWASDVVTPIEKVTLV